MTTAKFSLRGTFATDAAVFLLSVVVIASQVVLMQALSQVQGYHFACIVISLALLGFGGSGTVIALTKDGLRSRVSRLVPLCMLLAATGCLVTLPAALYAAARADLQILVFEYRAWIPLLAAALFVFIPFFFEAFALGLVFVRDASIIGRRYAANLLGSAGGGGLGLVLLLWRGPEKIIPLFSSILAAAVLVLIFSSEDKTGRFKWCAVSLILLFAGVAVHVAAPPLPLSPYKDLSAALRLPESRVVTDHPHPMGRVQVVHAPSLRYGPGLSLFYDGEIPVAPRLYLNGDEYGTCLPPAEKRPPILDYSVTALPLLIGEFKRALVLNAGAGASLGHLLSHDIPHVKGVEPHPDVVDQLTMRYGTSLSDGRLSLAATDSRFYVQRGDSTYDLILLPLQGTFGGDAGLQALQENYLLTRESFRTLWKSLDEGGILSFSVYIDRPPRRGLKLLALLVETMRGAGIEFPSRHVAALRNWDMMTLVASPSPLGESARLALARAARRGGFDRAWIPGIGPAETDRHHVTEDDFLRTGMRLILEGRGESFIESYPFSIRPPSDDRPYFHQFLRWNHVTDAKRMMGAGTVSFVELGSLLMGITALLLASAAFILILLPLFRMKRASGRQGAMVFVLFAAFGTGFMFLEIMFIQRLTLYWGHPIYSAAGVISALLCGMGIGSLTAQRMRDTPFMLPAVLAAVCAVVTASLTFFPVLFDATLAFPGLSKSFIGLVALALPAFFLGMPFPLAMRRVDRDFPALTPWAWGINGFFSVLAAPLAAMLAMHVGFTMVGWCAAFTYLAALVASLIFRNTT
ncbi:MAG: hypothetical protein AVO39_06040 [delta proteobacterium MLS_D]|jgi:predicted membrane-bound spermidine synthase|nr:MAG: hypothetical protein AVO39_06040 [delta proteobacterium MLS_D]